MEQKLSVAGTSRCGSPFAAKNYVSVSDVRSSFVVRKFAS